MKRTIAFYSKIKNEVRENFFAKFDNLKCSGIELLIRDQNIFLPIETATSMLILINQLFPRQFQWEENNYIDKQDD